MFVCSVLIGHAQTLQINRVPADIISFQGVSGVPYTIETSTNLTNWSVLRVLNGTPTGYHHFTNFPVKQVLFYRTSTVLCFEAIKVSLSPSSPQPTAIFATSGSNSDEADGVTVAVYDISSTNISSTLKDLKVTINTTAGNPNRIFPVMYLYHGSTSIGSTSTVSNSPTSASGIFNDLDFVLPPNSTSSFRLKMDVRNIGLYPDGVKAFTVLHASGIAGGYSNNPVVVDGGNNRVGVQSSTVIGYTNLFIKSGAMHTLTSSPNATQLSTDRYAIDFCFRLEAVSGDVYISRGHSVAFNVTPGANVALCFWEVGSALETADYYVIPEGNFSNIKLLVLLDNADGLATPKTLSINSIHYGDSSTNLTNRVMDYNLEPFTKTVQF